MADAIHLQAGARDGVLGTRPAGLPTVVAIDNAEMDGKPMVLIAISIGQVGLCIPVNPREARLIAAAIDAHADKSEFQAATDRG